jgi:hypothetical protein
MRTATVRYLDTGCEISSFYDDAWLTELKREIPYFARTWEKTRRLWLIDTRYVTVAIEVTKRHFRVVELNARREQQQSHSEHARTATGAARHGRLLPSAPHELIHSTYRCLAKLYHPDHDGDVDKMQQLNRAYETLKHDTDTRHH